MPAVNPYLTFNGNCGEAFDFYKSVFGGEFTMKSQFKDVPSDSRMSEKDGDKIMHVSLSIGQTTIMGSDTSEAHGNVVLGGNFSISLNADSEDQASKIFKGLSSGGKVTMPMAKTFWGAFFGMLTDKFGIQWMVNYDYK